MEYKCPQCGIKMEPIFCECEEVAGLHVDKHPDGLYRHSRCGRVVPKKTMDLIEKWREEGRQERGEHGTM